MRRKSLVENTPTLTPQQKLRVAVAVLIDGMDQYKIASLFGVNPGRVNEAVVAVRKAITDKAEAQPEVPRESE